MSCIIHYQCPIGLLLLNGALNIGICEARRRRFATVSIPHHLANNVPRMSCCSLFGSVIGVFHMEISVSVVAHKQQSVLPRTRVGITSIGYRLVDKRFGIVWIDHREAPDSYILLVGLLQIAPLAVV